MYKRIFVAASCVTFFACSSAMVSFYERPNPKYSFADKKIGFLLEASSLSSQKIVLSQYQYNLYKYLENNGAKVFPIILKRETNTLSKHPLPLIRQEKLVSYDPFSGQTIEEIRETLGLGTLLKDEKHVLFESAFDMATALGKIYDVDYILYSHCKSKIRRGSEVYGVRESGARDLLNASYEYGYIFQLINVESHKFDIVGAAYSKSSCEKCSEEIIQGIKKGIYPAGNVMDMVWGLFPDWD